MCIQDSILLRATCRVAALCPVNDADPKPQEQDRPKTDSNEQDRNQPQQHRKPTAYSDSAKSRADACNAVGGAVHKSYPWWILVSGADASRRTFWRGARPDLL